MSFESTDRQPLATADEIQRISAADDEETEAKIIMRTKKVSPSAWYIFRRSKTLVVSVVFMAMMLDLIIMTSIDPLLPVILLRMDEKQGLLNSTNLTLNSSLSTTNSGVERRVGILIALKPATEVVANIVVGGIVAKVGHMTPMMIGFIFNTASTLGFAYAPSFMFLVISRACQAIASSLSVISGLALISCTFLDETERSKAFSTAFAGLSLGIVLGYPFGSITYQFLGRTVPFIMLAVLSLGDGLLRSVIASPEHKDKPNTKDTEQKTAYFKLLKDPYIVCALVGYMVPNFSLGVFLATGPAWMLSELHAEQWEIGVVLAIAMIFQIVAQFITGIYATRVGRWRFCMLGMWFNAMGMLIYPHCTIIWMVTGAEILTRCGFGMLVCVISPMLGHLVDIRHDSNYGEVFGLYTASYNIGLSIGPILGGFLLDYIRFGTLYRSVAALLFASSWIYMFFRKPQSTVIVLDDEDEYDNCLRRTLISQARIESSFKNGESCDFSRPADGNNNNNEYPTVWYV